MTVMADLKLRVPVLFSVLFVGTVISSSGLERWRVLEDYLKTSDFLSADLKKACREYPQFSYQLAYPILYAIYCAIQRVDNDIIDESELRIKSGKPRLHDFLLALNCYSTYGQAAIEGDTFVCLSGEPTSQEHDRFDLTFNLWKKPAFKSYFAMAYDTIAEVGHLVKWDDEKIAQEKKEFCARMAAFLQNNDGCLILNSRLLDYRQKIAQAKLESLKKALAEEKKCKKDWLGRLNDLQAKLVGLSAQNGN